MAAVVIAPNGDVHFASGTPTTSASCRLVGRVGTPVAIDSATVPTTTSPVVVTTSRAHGLSSADDIVIVDVVANAGSPGRFTVTTIDLTRFSLNGTNLSTPDDGGITPPKPGASVYSILPRATSGRALWETVYA